MNKDVPCCLCGGLESELRNLIVACDGCDEAFHQQCLQPELIQVPEGEWFCHECEPEYKAVKESEPTYLLARPPRGDRSEKRAAAGLRTGLETTDQEVDALLRFAYRESTYAKIETLKKNVARIVNANGKTVDQPGVFELYVTCRIKNGISARTVRGEMSLLRTVPGLMIPSEAKVSTLARAVRNAGDVAGEAKDPLTLRELRAMREALLDDFGSRDGEAQRRSLRDWAFFLLSFVGMFRGSELLRLRWEDVKVGWRVRGRAIDYEVSSAVPRGATLTHATLFIIESKTTTEPYPVRVAAGTYKADLSFDESCPVRLLLTMFENARGPFVFEEIRSRLPPAALKSKTMRSILKRTLKKAGVEPDKVKRLSLHSLRRGGATTVAATGSTIREIKLHGHWRSDVAYIYALVSDQDCVKVSDRILTGLRDLPEDDRSSSDSDEGADSE